MIGLNQLVTIERATETTNDLGEPIKTWATLASSVQARIITASPLERQGMSVMAGGQHEIATHKILFRSTTDVEPGDRVVFLTQKYRVLSVDDVDKMGHHKEAWATYIEGVTT